MHHSNRPKALPYSEWQRATSDRLAEEPARRFQPYIKPNDVVIDLGCGSGAVLEALRCGTRIGVEPNNYSRTVAESRNMALLTSISQAAAESADVVISNHALEHCERPVDELRLAARALKPGGLLVVIVPVDDWRGERDFRSDDINHHLYTWTPQLLGNLISDAGLRVISIAVITHAWPPFAHILWRRLPRAVFDLLGYLWAFLRRRRQVLAVARV